MEMLSSSSTLVSLFCIIVVTVFVKLVNWVWLRPRKLERWLRQQGIPGTSYRLLFGDLKDYSSMRSRALESPMASFSNEYLPRVEPLRHQLLSKFGRDYFVWAGPTPMLNISSPELIKEALTRMQEFRKPRLNPISGKVFPGLVSYEGDKWVKHRKMITPAFNMDKLKLVFPAFLDSCTEMINKWEKIVPETGYSEIDVWPHLTTLTADVISRAAFGSSYQDGQRTFELLKEQSDLAAHMLKSVYIPGLRHLPTARNRRFKEVQDQIQTSLKGIVNKRKDIIKTGEAAKTDLLGLLMDSNLKEVQVQQGSNMNHQLGMSVQEVIDECKLFYIAGQETTSMLIAWTLILLSQHQEWQAQARDEVSQTFGTNLPDFEGLNRLKTVTMILYEVLRLYPPATQVTRRIYKNTNLGQLSLPAGALISLHILFLHRDKDAWGEDAEEFRPDRFSDGIAKATKGNNTFFPFGWGPRICLGDKFAMTEAKMALSMILQRFSFELLASYVHAPMINIVFLQPQHGAKITLHRL